MVQLAFYKGKGRLFDKLIRWWTKGRYSHCELVFKDGAFFSADAWKGIVRFEKVDANPANWDFVDVPMDTFDENRLYRWCLAQEGKGYDWLGIVGAQILPLSIEDPLLYFCSEVCVEGLQQVGKLKGVVACDVSPSRLATLYNL